MEINRFYSLNEYNHSGIRELNEKEKGKITPKNPTNFSFDFKFENNKHITVFKISSKSYYESSNGMKCLDGNSAYNISSNYRGDIEKDSKIQIEMIFQHFCREYYIISEYNKEMRVKSPPTMDQIDSLLRKNIDF